MTHRSFMPREREAELCREAEERARERAAIEKTTPYKKREWTQSVLDFYNRYKQKDVELGATKAKYEEFRDTFGTKHMATMSAEQHDRAAALANAWEMAALEYATFYLPIH